MKTKVNFEWSYLWTMPKPGSGFINKWLPILLEMAKDVKIIQIQKAVKTRRWLNNKIPAFY